MSILVVAAHPDDEVLGCGATIAKMASHGHDVHIAILGEGITSRADSPADVDPAQLAALRDSAERASKILGAAGLRLFDFPDNRLDTVPLLDVIKVVESVIAELSPETVLTHSAGDLNVDHRRVFEAVVTATRPTQSQCARTVLSFEVPSSTEWSFGRTGCAFAPSVFYDVSETLDNKLEAMAAYDGESRPFPHPRSPEALRALATSRGSAVGVSAAEAFELVREVR